MELRECLVEPRPSNLTVLYKGDHRKKLHLLEPENIKTSIVFNALEWSGGWNLNIFTIVHFHFLPTAVVISVRGPASLLEDVGIPKCAHPWSQGIWQLPLYWGKPITISDPKWEQRSAVAPIVASPLLAYFGCLSPPRCLQKILAHGTGF